MTQTAKHTPGPWVCNNECLIYGQVSSDHEPEAPFVADCARECAAGQYTEQEKANTEFIVRACNAHRDLIEALEYVAMTFADIAASKRKGYYENCPKIVSAAIAKATA